MSTAAGLTDLIGYLDASPSPWHAVASSVARLQAAGFTQVELAAPWTEVSARGYVVRDRQSGLYSFSMMTFDLAHRHPPLRGLIMLATTPMRELSDRVRQSCNLSVLDAARVRVIAQVESPADFGYRVRVGAVFPLETATGEVLEGAAALTRADPLQAGITDVVAPIVDARGVTRAALTVPYVATTFSGIPVDEVVAAAEDTASEISRLLQGEPR